MSSPTLLLSVLVRRVSSDRGHSAFWRCGGKLILFQMSSATMPPSVLVGRPSSGRRPLAFWQVMQEAEFVLNVITYNAALARTNLGSSSQTLLLRAQQKDAVLHVLWHMSDNSRLQSAGLFVARALREVQSSFRTPSAGTRHSAFWRRGRRPIGCQMSSPTVLPLLRARRPSIGTWHSGRNAGGSFLAKCRHLLRCHRCLREAQQWPQALGLLAER